MNLDPNTVRAALHCLTNGPYRLDRDHVDAPVFRELRKRRLVTMTLGVGVVTFALTDAGRAALGGSR